MYCQWSKKSSSYIRTKRMLSSSSSSRKTSYRPSARFPLPISGQPLPISNRRRHIIINIILPDGEGRPLCVNPTMATVPIPQQSYLYFTVVYIYNTVLVSLPEVNSFKCAKSIDGLQFLTFFKYSYVCVCIFMWIIHFQNKNKVNRVRTKVQVLKTSKSFEI